MDYLDLWGTFAAVLTLASFIPQLVRILKTRKTDELSELSYALLIIASFMWLTYGFFLGAMPIIVLNVSLLAIAIILFSLKLRYG